MPVTNPFGSSGAPAAPPSGGVINPFGVAGSAIQALNPVDDQGGNSIGGFLGNVWGGVTGIVGGITSLVGQAVHDALLLTHGPSALDHPEDFELFQTAKALPAALTKDYKTRYGISDFAHGDIWGGIKDIGAGLYDNPIAYVGDALMVGKAASVGASIGRVSELGEMGVDAAKIPYLARHLPDVKLVPDALAKPILGSGTREAASLTGATTEFAQSINPVARLAQNKAIDLFSLSPEKAVAWVAERNPGNPEALIADLGAYVRGDTAVKLAASRGVNILRPTFSKALENRFTGNTMGVLGINTRMRSSRLVGDTVEVLSNPDATEADLAVLAETIQGTLPVGGPAIRPTMRIIDDGFESQYAGAPPEVTPELDGQFLQDIGFLGRDKLGHNRWDLVSPEDPMSPSVTPHNNGGAGTRITVTSGDETGQLLDAPSVLQQVAERTGGDIEAVANDFANAGSFDAYTAWIRNRERNTVSEVSVVTKDLLHEQAKWGANQKQIVALTAEADALRMQIAAAGEAGDAGAEARLLVIGDELKGARAANNYAFRYTRRKMSSALSGEEYTVVQQMSDKLAAISHAGTGRIELAHGALSYRKMWDRAFLPQRANRHAVLMNEIEKDLADLFQRTLDAGGTRDDALLEAVDIISARLGVGHPAIVKAIGDALTQSKVDEIIPFSTEEFMPGFIDPDMPQLGGTLRTGEKTIKSNWWGSGDPTIAAKNMRDRIYELTHQSIVVDGEFPSFGWEEMLAQAELDPMLDVPSYYPHVIAKKFTGEAMMMRGRQQTQLLSETARMDKNEAKLFEQGLYDKDPLAAYSRVYREIAKHDETRDALWTMKEKYGRIPVEEELQAVAINGSPSGEVYMSTSGVNALIDARKSFIALKHDGMMNGLSPETATMDALKAINDKALAAYASGETAAGEIWAIPAHVAKTMDQYFRPLLDLPPKSSFFYNTLMQGWKTSVLGLSPRWLVNNTLGNLVYMGIKDPGAIKRYIELLMSPKKRAYVEAMFGKTMTDAVYRDFIRGEMSMDTLAQRARDAGAIGMSQKLETIGGKPLLSNEAHPSFLQNPTKYMSQHVYHWNQINEDAARMGVAISYAEKKAQLGVMSQFQSSYTVMRKINESGFSSMGQYASVAEHVNAVLGDFLRLSPTEKMIKQYVIPFYPFYRHTAMFVARMPFESPFKSAILANINRVDAEMKGALPDYMQNGNSNEILPGWWMRVGNANPLQAVTDAYLPALMNPLLGLAIGRLTGANPFGEPWRAAPGTLVETHSGSQYEILHNPDGSYAGIRPVTGNWEPPLMDTIMHMVPQYGLIFGGGPFKPKSLPLRALGMSGLSVSDFDQPNFAYQEALNQMEALTAGANAAARY